MAASDERTITFPSRDPYWTRVSPTDRQLWAIGLICVEWAQLETIMDTCIGLLAGAEFLKQYKRTPSFKERARQWKGLIETKIVEPWRADLLAIADRASGMQQERDRIVHGSWGRDDVQVREGHKIDTFNLGGSKRPFEWTLTYSDLRSLARKIDRINKDYFELFLNAAGRPQNFWLSDALKRISLPQGPTPTQT